MAAITGTKRKNDWETIVGVISKKPKTSSLWPSLVYHPNGVVDNKAPNTEFLSARQKGKVLNAPVADMGDYQLLDGAEIQNSHNTNKGQATVHTASIDESAANGPAREAPASCSSTHLAIPNTETDTVVSLGGCGGIAKRDDDTIVALVNLCQSLRDRNDAAVLLAQINIGRNYCAVLEENQKLRDELTALEARHRHVVGQPQKSELAPSAEDAQLNEAENRLVAKKALEYMEMISK
ncbi:hypothetical protein F5Y13DRAFT_43366 [Hypoxylon sp. FL1857]|nr:hypothetical protein F5Y13DRAFT_43366 [Hypoxylon sp. FL1857]